MSRNTPEKPRKLTQAAQERARRRAEALRDNLKRRKAADRAVAEKAGKADPEGS